MRLIQLQDDTGAARVGVVSTDGRRVRLLDGVATTYALASAAITAGRSLEQQADALAGTCELDYSLLLAEGRVLTPLQHPDPAHCPGVNPSQVLAAGADSVHCSAWRCRDHSLA